MKKISAIEKKRFEIREPLRSFLTTVKNIFDYDSCAFYIISEYMDIYEKKEVFKKRYNKGYADITDKEQLHANDTVRYEVLKFIGVEDSYESENKIINYWEYDYEKRPNKYIVFKEYHDLETIYGEGITARAARRQKAEHMDEAQIYSCKSRGNNDDTERNIHPKCKELFVIPITKEVLKGKEKRKITVGVIRLDIYNNDKKNRNKINTNKYLCNKKEKIKNTDNVEDTKRRELDFDVLLEFINDYCLQVIEISNKDSTKYSYEELFHGKNIVDAIKYLQDSNSICDFECNNKLFDLTKHLFFVFQRHTYIGYEEIMIRTMCYIKDVFKYINMEMYYNLTEEKLLKFMDHEKLMLYSTEKYRDHFMHQFHVFVLGYIFLNFIGIEKITKVINDRLMCTDEYKNIKIDDEGVLRIWILISFFHDITYIFQNYDKTMQKFISDQLLSDIPVHIDWGSILSSKKSKASYINTISELTSFFTSPIKDNKTNKIELLKNYIQALEDNQDHGVLSATLLINLFIPTIQNNYKGNHKVINQRTVEVYLAALAISLHNSCTFKSLKEAADMNYISFESFPLEFLLMYCDTAQEWGRKKEVDEKFYDAPELKSIRLNKDRKEIICELFYNSLKHPDEEKLNSFFQEKKSKFHSGDTNFGITYEYETSEVKTSFYFTCHDKKDVK